MKTLLLVGLRRKVLKKVSWMHSLVRINVIIIINIIVISLL